MLRLKCIAGAIVVTTLAALAAAPQAQEAPAPEAEEAPAEAQTGDQEPSAEQEASGGEASGDAEALVAAGEPLYLVNCRQCHGTKGTAGVPLAGNEKVYPEWTASVILTGPGYMPAFDEVLSDEQIAAIATYVASSWGNDFGMVTPEDVGSLR